MPGGSPLNTVYVQQSVCGGGAEYQAWRLVPLDGAYQIVSVATGKCLAVRDGSVANGAIIQQ